MVGNMNSYSTAWSDRPAFEVWPHHKETMSSGAGCLTSLGLLTCKQDVTIAPNSQTCYWLLTELVLI